MKIFGYTLRKPWVKYVDITLEEEVYWAIRRSILEDFEKEIRQSLKEQQ